MSTLSMDAQSMPSTNTSTFTNWMQKHPLVAFFSIAIASTWLLDLPMVRGKDGLGLLPYSVPMALYIALFAHTLGNTLDVVTGVVVIIKTK